MPPTSFQPPAPTISQAFILCAGLGTRMRPLTDHLPKPLLPVFQEPMIVHTLRRYRRLGIRRFIINTHHLPEKWEQFFPGGTWEDCDIDFVYEPVLLDTGGGLYNIRNLVDMDSPLLVHNGDIVETMDAARLMQKHAESGSTLTMALRSGGDLVNVGFDPQHGLVTDVRSTLGVTPGTHQFAGIYCIDPVVLKTMHDQGPVSIVPVWLELIRNRQASGAVIDDGLWFNVGSPETYLDMHLKLMSAMPELKEARIHPSASIPPSSLINQNAILGVESVIGHGCDLSDCIVWPHARVPEGTKARRQIFTS